MIVDASGTRGDEKSFLGLWVKMRVLHWNEMYYLCYFNIGVLRPLPTRDRFIVLASIPAPNEERFSSMSDDWRASFRRCSPTRTPSERGVGSLAGVIRWVTRSYLPLCPRLAIYIPVWSDIGTTLTTRKYDTSGSGIVRYDCRPHEFARFSSVCET